MLLDFERFVGSRFLKVGHGAKVPIGGCGPDDASATLGRILHLMEDGSTYIRGAGANHVDPRRVLQVVAWSVTALLVALSVYLLVATADRNSANVQLRDHGVAVRVTVTSCTGISDGIGMGVEYWQCTGSFAVDGRTYTELINKSRLQHPTGETLAAVVVPSDPSSLALATSPDSSYVPGIVVAAATLLYIGVLIFWTRRRPAQTEAPARAK